MAQTEKDARKLLSCSYTFCVLKLIIFVLVLFISIKGDDGDNVHREGGNGSDVDVDGGVRMSSTGPAARQAYYEFITNGNGRKNGERILSRRRRYLIFPEGSSLQVGMYWVMFSVTLMKIGHRN